MSYADREASIEDGAPIECYEFTGTYKAYRYTSANLPQILGGNVYSTSNISRSTAKFGTQEESNISLDLQVPIDLSVVRDYGFAIAPPDLYLKVYRYHYGDDPNTSAVTYWSGQVGSITADDITATIKTPSRLAVILQTNIPRPFYQRMCNFTLFDQGCKLSRAANSFATTISTVSGYSVRVASTGSLTRLIGGEIVCVVSGERRTITQVVGTTLRISFPFSSQVRVGLAVTLVNGCGHAWADCVAYNNKQNFGGTKDIPEENMFTDGL